MNRKIPPAPVGFDPKQFFAGAVWFQKWQLFEGVFTPGVNPIEEMCCDLALPNNLVGKRILDIGAWNGCLSLECERRGAREVIALSPEDPEATGFHKLCKIAKSRKVSYVRGTVYDLDPRKLGYFDIVLFCGVLYHLRYPTLGIDNIRRVCTGDLYVETVVCDSHLLINDGNGLRPIGLGEISPLLSSTPLWQFYRFSELSGDPSNWFGPNCTAVISALESAGFETRLVKNCGGRATFHAKVKEGPPEFLTIGSAEGFHYDIVTSHLLGHASPSEGSRTITEDHASFSHQVLATVLSSEEYFQKKGAHVLHWMTSVYKELLGRDMDRAKGELNVKNTFENAHAFRLTVIEHLLTCTEYRLRVVKDHYATILGRAASAAELGYWLRGTSGAWPESIHAAFLASDELFKKQEGSNRQWLDFVYSRLLGTSTTLDKDLFLEALEMKTANRERIAASLLDSLEHRERFIEEVCSKYLNLKSSEIQTTRWLQRIGARAA
jgi:tRNA (mo5U34)-methyltransferase